MHPRTRAAELACLRYAACHAAFVYGRRRGEDYGESRGRAFCGATRVCRASRRRDFESRGHRSPCTAVPQLRETCAGTARFVPVAPRHPSPRPWTLERQHPRAIGANGGKSRVRSRDTGLHTDGRLIGFPWLSVKRANCAIVKYTQIINYRRFKRMFFHIPSVTINI